MISADFAKRCERHYDLLRAWVIHNEEHARIIYYMDGQTRPVRQHIELTTFAEQYERSKVERFRE